MEKVAVTSSNLSAIGYDPETQDLEVDFTNGSSYRYHDVPRSVFDDLMSSPSKGSFFHQNIRNHFGYDRV